MAKYTPETLQGGFSDKDTINAEFQKIANIINNEMLSRNNQAGEPNQLQSDLDVNSKTLYNVPNGTENSHAVNYGQLVSQAGITAFSGTVVETATATAGQTVFNLSTVQYVVGLSNLSVYINGVRQETSTDYTETSATVVTFLAGLEEGDRVIFLVNERSVSAEAVTMSSVTGTVDSRGTNSLDEFNRIARKEVADYAEFRTNLTAGVYAADELVTVLSPSGPPFKVEAIGALVDDAGVTITGGSWGAVRQFDGAVSVKWFGAVGDDVDDTTAITNCLAAAQGKKVTGVAGETYVSTTEQQMLPSTALDLSGSTLKFNITGSSKALIPATGCEVHNGTIEVNGTTPSGSGDTQCPVLLGNFQTGAGINNVEVHDLTLITNKPDGGYVNVYGGTYNFKIYNIVAIGNATANNVVECHWGGQFTTDTIEHPHNGDIYNIECDNLTSATAGGAAVFLSAVYNIQVRNIRCKNVFRALKVSAGDYGDDYSVAEQKGKIGTGISIDNFIAEDVFKTGLDVDGYTSFGLTNDSVTGDTNSATDQLTNVSSVSKLFVGRVINIAGVGEFQIKGISGATVTLDRVAGTTAVGAAITGGSWALPVEVKNSKFELDNSGTNVAPQVIQAVTGATFENLELAGGALEGVAFSNWVHGCKWVKGSIHDNQNNGVNENRSGKANGNTWDGVEIYRNNLAAGTGRTDSVGVYLTSKRNKVINCIIGQESQETQYIAVSVEGGAEDNDILNNNILGAVSGGFAFRNGAAGTSEDYAVKTLATGNTVASGISVMWNVSGGNTPMLTERSISYDGSTSRANIRFNSNFKPTTGSFTAGDKVDQSAPAIGTTQGWDRLTTGSGHVVDTDWRLRPIL
jgi:hypothetical protein